MTVRLVELVHDALDPEGLARFWALALGWPAGRSVDGGVALVPDDATGFSLRFRRVTWPKVGQNRIHLDLTTASPDDQSATVAALLEAGGSHADVGQGPDETHVVLADPEGDELCVLAPGSRFLAGCPRLGAVNCDGTHALGLFWSAALGWPLVWDQGEETAVQAPGGVGPKVTWSGPPLMDRHLPERVHFHVTPATGGSVDAAASRLEQLGATRTPGHGCPGARSFADVDGNDFCLVG